MGPQSLITTSTCCCQLFNHDRRIHHDSASTLGAPKASFLVRRKGVLICKSQDGTSDPGTEKDNSSASIEDTSPKTSPFAAGKISSRVAAAKPVQQSDPTKTSASSRPPVADVSRKPLPDSKVASPFSSKSGPSLSTGKLSSRSSAAKPPSKAFPAPAVSSPFDSSPPAKRASRRSPVDIDERILASRKEILDTLWKERRQQQRLNAAPADIFDDPKPSDSDKEYKFELIRGTSPIVLIISFSLIVALMFGTAFVAWKLGAFHYDEL